MNAHEIAIALVGRKIAEEALRHALLELIEAEKRRLSVYPSDAEFIVREADNFFRSWEGVRRFGDTRLFIEGIEPIEITEAALTFRTTNGGFKITVDADTDDLCEMFLSSEIVDMVERGDTDALFDFVCDEVNAMKEAYSARLEKVRSQHD